MRLYSTLAAALALCPVVAAQTASSTLPNGLDTTKGSSYRWAGWDLYASSSNPYVNFYQPARMIDIYNAISFPFDTSTAVFTITKISLRKDETYGVGVSPAHTGRVRVDMSTDGLPANTPNWWVTELNHGSNKTLVVGTTTRTGYVTYNFPATPEPPIGKTAAFNLVFPLTKPMVIPKGTKSITVDWRHYGTNLKTPPSVRFRPDADYASTGMTRNSGRTAIVAGSVHCASPSMVEYSASSSWPGNSLVYRVNTRRKNALTIAFIGSRLASGISLAGTGTTTSGPCKIWVNGFLFMVAISDNSTNGVVQNVFGQIPAGAGGQKVSHQMLVFDAAAKGGLITSRAVETTIGTGYLPANKMRHTTMYSYGTYTTQSGPRVDPDTEKEPYWVSSYKSNVLKLN